MDDGFPYECLVDPEAAWYDAVGIGRVGATEWLKPASVGDHPPVAMCLAALG
jgi:hypothetical protein